MFRYLVLCLMCTFVDQALSDGRVVSMKITDYSNPTCTDTECTPCLNIDILWDNSLTCGNPDRKTCECCNNCDPDICSCPKLSGTFDQNTDSKLIQRQVPNNQTAAVVWVYACRNNEFISDAKPTDVFLPLCTAIIDLSKPSQNLLMHSKGNLSASLRFQWNISTMVTTLPSKTSLIKRTSPATRHIQTTPDYSNSDTKKGPSAAVIAGAVIGTVLGVAVIGRK